MKCMLFGATGYLGRHLAHALRQKGHELVIPMSGGGQRVDISQPRSLLGIDWDVDAVFMFAGVTGTAASFYEYRKFLTGNDLALLNVLDAIRLSKAHPRVIFPSTRLVFRGDDKALPEHAPQEARTPYAASKIACEHYLRAYANAFDIPHTILRICVPYANLLGGNYSFGTTGNFINQARSSGCIRLYGGGAIRRSFTHIEDLCRLVLLAAQCAETTNRTYNMPGEDLSLNEAARMVADAIGGTNIESVEWPDFDARIESGSTVFDGASLLNTLKTGLDRQFATWAQSIR